MARASRPARVPWLWSVALLCVLGLSACDTVEVPGDEVACAGLRCTAGTCFSNAGQPMCRCGPWERAASVPCAVAAFKTPDDHGGSPDTATVLTVPMSPREARIDEGQREEMLDRDLFAFTVHESGIYRFACTRLTLAACRVRLLDAAGNSVRYFPFETEGATTSWSPKLTEGTWYFEVSGEDKSGRYTYELMFLGADDHGNAWGDATVLEEGSGTPFPVRLSVPSDLDVFTFRARAGHGYRFICEREPGPQVWLVLSSEGHGGGDVDLDDSGAPVVVSLEASSARDWFVEVSAGSGPFPVDLRCRFEDLGLDEHGDTLATATPLTPGVPVDVTLQSREDVDVFSFTGAPGHVYTVRTEGLGTWSAQVVDATGANVASSTTDRLRARMEVEGTYYLKVQGGELWAHSFQLTLVDAGVDDHGDSPETATFVAPGTSVTGRFETPYDTDAIAFWGEPRGVYLAAYAPSAELAFNPRGAVSILDLGNGHHLFSAWGEGPVTMMFQPLRGVEGFSLQLTQEAVDDYGDHSGDAQELPLPVSVSGVVQTAIDTDVFSVALEAGRAYRLGLDVGTLRLTLLAPDGTLSRPQAGIFRPTRTGNHLLTLTGAAGRELVPWRISLQAE
ncbi:hypothetical protein [Myxococcus sp. Y35]|uniref:hypothetical protein n=1 Tax=Pseudomyxococcus flavus TaxID=3115648 RepID=UPI003CECC159